MKYKIFAVLILALSFPNVLAQNETPATTPKTISGGVLNGKAISLAKPFYPPAAKAAKAAGAVIIQITIDETGNVISAKAVSGHPLFYEVCEQAARESKFPPTMLSGQPVKVTGVIVYNFVLPMPFLQIGYELALAEKSPIPEIFPLASLAGTLPSVWKEEKDELYKLESFSTETPPVAEKSSAEKTPEPSTQPNTGDKNLGKTVSTGSIALYKPTLTATTKTYQLTLSSNNPDSVEILKNVQAKLENRLSPNKKTLWYFMTGRVLGSIAAESADNEKLRKNLKELTTLSNEFPPNIPDSFLQKIQEIVNFSKQADFDAKTKEKLMTLVENLRYLQVD